MSRPLPPPLRAMLIALGPALLGIAVVAASYYRYHRSIEDVYLSYDRERLAKLAAEYPDAEGMRVVGVGTSLLRAGTFPDGAMNALASDMDIPVKYVKIVRSNGGTRDWHLVMEDVMRARPHVAVIEARYLFFRVRILRHHLRAAHRHARRLKKRRKQSALWGRAPEEVRASILRRESAPEHGGRWERAKRREKHQRGVLPWPRGFDAREGCEEVFAAFKAAGVRVVILEMPIHPQEETARRAARMSEAVEMDARLAALERAGLIKRLRCPLRFRHADFRDGRHMRSGARRRFSAWLLRELWEMRGE